MSESEFGTIAISRIRSPGALFRDKKDLSLRKTAKTLLFPIQESLKISMMICVE